MLLARNASVTFVICFALFLYFLINNVPKAHVTKQRRRLVTPNGLQRAKTRSFQH